MRSETTAEAVNGRIECLISNHLAAAVQGCDLGGSRPKIYHHPTMDRGTPLRRTLAYAAKEGCGPSSLVLPAACAALGASCEALGAFFLVPALEASVAMRFDSFGTSGAAAWLARGLPAGAASGRGLFIAVLGAIVAAALAKTLLMHAAAVLFARKAHRFAGIWRADLFGRFLAADKRFFDESSLGNLHDALLGHIQKVTTQVIQSQEAVSHLFLFSAYVCVMVWISWRLTLAAFVLLPLIHFVSDTLTGTIRKTSLAAAAVQRRLSSRLTEALANSALVRTEDCALAEASLIAPMADEADALQASIDTNAGLTPKVQETVFILMMVALLLSLTLLRDQREPSVVPALLVFVYAARRASITAMAAARLKAAAAAIEGTLADIWRLADRAEALRMHSGTLYFRGLEHGISIRNLSFTHPGGRLALSEVSFEVPRGCTVALVGPSGSGKTTLVNLMLRHYPPPPGTIFLDGTDICALSAASLAAGIAVVPQETRFFDGTIRMNLSYPFLGSIEEARLQAAVAEAGLSEFVAAQEHGLEARIGENGGLLSGGERQRLAIARAILKDSDILVFDEATSSLDSEAEAVVLRSLARNAGRKTSIVVAHRLATVQSADWIVVLDGGQVVQTGRFSELKSSAGLFRRLLEAQSFR